MLGLTLALSWGSYQDLGLSSGNDAEQNNKTAAKAHGVSPLPTTAFKPNITSVQFTSLPAVSVAAVEERIEKTSAPESAPVVTETVTRAPVATPAPAPVKQPVAETVVVKDEVAVATPAATAALEKKRQAAFTNDYDQFLARANSGELFHDFARQLPLSDEHRRVYALPDTKTYGDVEAKLKQYAAADEIEEFAVVLDEVAEGRAENYYFDKRDGIVKSDADYLSAAIREHDMIAKMREADVPKPAVSFVAEYNKFYNQAPATVTTTVQPAAVAVDSVGPAVESAAPAETRSISIDAAEASGWENDNNVTPAVDSSAAEPEREVIIIREPSGKTTFAPGITQPAFDAKMGMLDPAPGELGPVDYLDQPLEPLNGLSMEYDKAFVGPRLHAENVPELENVAAGIKVEMITPLAAATVAAEPVIEKLTVTPENVAALNAKANEAAKVQPKIKVKRAFKPVFERRNALSEDSVADAVWRTKMPRFVNNYRDSLVYAYMKQRASFRESSYSPIAVNPDTKASGLWAIHPITQKYISKQLGGIKYPKGKAALTKEGILTQSLFKTQHDQNSINAFYARDLKRRRQGKPELHGLDCVVGTGFKNGKPTRYMPLTFDDITVAAGMQAGTKFLDFLYEELDRKLAIKNRSKNPNVRNAPIVFDHLYVIKSKKKTYRQDFYQFMTDVAQNPAKKAIHLEMGQKVAAKGHRVDLPMYTKEAPVAPKYTQNNKSAPAQNLTAQQASSKVRQMQDNMAGAQKVTDEIKVDPIDNTKAYERVAQEITARRVAPIIFSSVLRF